MTSIKPTRVLVFVSLIITFSCFPSKDQDLYIIDPAILTDPEDNSVYRLHQDSTMEIIFKWNQPIRPDFVESKLIINGKVINATDNKPQMTYSITIDDASYPSNKPNEWFVTVKNPIFNNLGKKRYFTLNTFITSTTQTITPVTTTTIPGKVYHVVISSFAINGINGLDEFVELYNPSVVPIDISGYTLRGGTTQTCDTISSSNTRATIGAGVILPPGAFFLFMNSSITADTWGGVDTPDITYATGFAPSPAGRSMILADSSMDTGYNIIDAIGFTTDATPSCFEGNYLTLPAAAGVIAYSRNDFCVDTENNNADFTFSDDGPSIILHNSLSPLLSCP